MLHENVTDSLNYTITINGSHLVTTLTIMVRLFPPRADCNSLVRTESLYGTNIFFFPMARSASAL